VLGAPALDNGSAGYSALVYGGVSLFQNNAKRAGMSQPQQPAISADEAILYQPV
jgi:hypothetical protein